MTVSTSIRVVLWSALVGCVVAGSALLLLDWMMPGAVSIDPAVPGEIVVMVDGAVLAPGTFRLPTGSRLLTAIEAAGGFAPDADASGFNLAARIGDAERITVPSRISQASPPADNPDGAQPDPAGALIDINNAGIGELDQLPGVGPAIAQRILDYREANGPFRTIDQLAEIEGISLEMVEELRPLVTLGG